MTAPGAVPPGVMAELRRIPGVGPAMAADLYALGIRQVADLACADPSALYARLCDITGVRQDRCVLYTFRSAVYFAAHRTHDPELLKWWNWKDSA